MAHPVIPWPGGKRRLAKRIIELIPDHICYVEPFCGAAAILFLKEPSKAEVLNDINGDLVNLYRVIQHHLDEFIRQFRWALTSRQMFEWTKLSVPSTLTDVQRAARFYYLQKLAFGARVHGQSFGTSTTGGARLNLLRVEEELSLAHLRLSTVVVESLSWDACIARYDRAETLFFLDPPYWKTAGYGVPFELAQYQLLSRVMGALKGRAILTINDHPDMRRTFAAFPFDQVAITYTMAGVPGASQPGN